MESNHFLLPPSSPFHVGFRRSDQNRFLIACFFSPQNRIFLSLCINLTTFLRRSNSRASSAKTLQRASWCRCHHRFLQQYKSRGLQYFSSIHSTTRWKTSNIWSRYPYGDPSLQLRSTYLAQVGKKSSYCLSCYFHQSGFVCRHVYFLTQNGNLLRVAFD